MNGFFPSTGLKDWAKWPTYPMLFAKGELVGGIDIVKELIASGEFASVVPTGGNTAAKLKELVAKEPVMLFVGLLLKDGGAWDCGAY